MNDNNTGRLSWSWTLPHWVDDMISLAPMAIATVYAVVLTVMRTW